MRLLSLNVGQPELIPWGKEQVLTSIRKRPVEGPRHAGILNIEGDAQADLTVHGGELKAIYSYGIERYPEWEAFLGKELPFGAMGENFTTEGLLEEDVAVGDVFEVGGVTLQVTQPRTPCYKLAALYGRNDVISKFVENAWPGIYFRVLREGPVSAGDEIRAISRAEIRLSVSRLFQLRTGMASDPAEKKLALSIPDLPEFWREGIARRG